MKTSMLSAVLAFALAGCTTVTVGPTQTIKVGDTTLTLTGLEGYNRLAVHAPDGNGPNVFVPNNTIVIDQEPVRPIPSQGHVTIVWRLDADHDSAYIFPDNDAIKMQAGQYQLPPKLECGAIGAPKKSFVCTWPYAGGPAQWKYRIRVKNTSGQDPAPLDPWIYQP